MATAHTEVNYLLDAIEIKVDGYVLKPVDIEELLATLSRAILPRIQASELEYKDMLLKAVSTFIGGKKIEIIKFLIDNSNDEGIYNGSYENIVANMDVSKPTIVKTFKQLVDVGLLTKIKNKTYKLHPEIGKKHI